MHGLVGKALLQRQLLRREGRKPIAVNDQGADCAVAASQWCAGHGFGAAAARRNQSRKICNRGVDIVEVWAVDLPVLAINHAGQVLAVERKLAVGYSRDDPLRRAAGRDRAGPFLAVGDTDGDARCIEDARRGFRDPLQRVFGIGWRRCDLAQYLRARVLAFAACPQLVTQAEIDQRGCGLPLD